MTSDPHLKQIKVLLFAGLQAVAGQDEVNLEISEAQNCQQIYEQLKQQYGFTLPMERVRVAINHQFVDGSDEPKNGDILAFIPPVSGG